MKIEYKDFQINQENRYEICTGKMNTLEGSRLGLQFEVIFLTDLPGDLGPGQECFSLTDYVIAGQMRSPTIECIDKQDGTKSGGSGFSTQGGDMWATLFFSVHRDPREILLTASGSTPLALWLYENQRSCSRFHPRTTRDRGLQYRYRPCAKMIAVRSPSIHAEEMKMNSVRPRSGLAQKAG